MLLNPGARIAVCGFIRAPQRRAPAALAGLLQGRNFGKVVVRVAD